MQSRETMSLTKSARLETVGEVAEITTRDRSITFKIGENLMDWVNIGKNLFFKARSLDIAAVGSKVIDVIGKEGSKPMAKVYNSEKKMFDEETLSVASTADSDYEVDNCFFYAEGDFTIDTFKKTNDEIRSRYIQRLINMKILKPKPAKKHQTIIIFDWDDTLLSTNFLSKYRHGTLPEDVAEELPPLDKSARKLLLKAVSYGQTFVITNSSEGWVQNTAKQFLPRTHKLMVEREIKVISARGSYEGKFPGESRKWKIEAFLSIERYFEKDIITNLICLGDSYVEMEAAHMLSKKFSHAIVKTIKFREKPIPGELIKQQEIVKENFEQIYLGVKNIDIRLERKPQEEGSNEDEE